MKKDTIYISGMHCTSCSLMIEGTLEDDVNGITVAKANYVKQCCEVEYDDSLTTLEEIEEAIRKVGYEVVK